MASRFLQMVNKHTTIKVTNEIDIEKKNQEYNESIKEKDKKRLNFFNINNDEINQSINQSNNDINDKELNDDNKKDKKEKKNLKNLRIKQHIIVKNIKFM